MLALLTTLALVQATQPNTVWEYRLDGDTSEWADGVDIVQVDDELVIRLEGIGMRSLTGGTENLALLLDLDGDADTGADLTADGGVPGIDLRIDFNAVWPRPAQGERGRIGSMITAYTADGASRPVHQWDLDLQSAPTHAANAFEVRINESLSGASAEQAELPEIGNVSGVVLVQDRGNQRTIARKRLGSFTTAAAPQVEEATLPTKPDGAVRVVSWNVLWGGPTENPEQYAAVFDAVQPDVIVGVEWAQRDTTLEDVQAWFDQHLDDQWHVVVSGGQGVIIASRYDVVKEGPTGVDATPDNDTDPPMRLVSAVLDSPIGELTIGGVHLKCCGFFNSREDEKRAAEANAAAAALSQLHTGGPIVMAGDWNLVGSPDVLDVKLPKPIRVVEPFVLGDPATLYSWEDPEQDFGRSRLDYLLHSTDVAEANAFTFDPTKLGMENPSDHMLIVVDLVQP